jgi:hypothetical protein
MVEYDDPMSVFLYALRAPESKRQYPQRLKVFLNYAEFKGQIGQQAREFLVRAKTNPTWVQSTIMRFTNSQKGVRDEEISCSTIIISEQKLRNKSAVPCSISIYTSLFC